MRTLFFTLLFFSAQVFADVGTPGKGPGDSIVTSGGSSGGGSGDVTGPSSSTVDALVVFNGSSGKIIKVWNGADGYGYVTSGIFSVKSGTSAQYLRADGTVSDLNPAVIASTLTGFTAGAGSVSSADSVLAAIQKVVGNLDLKAPLANPTFTGTASGSFAGDFLGPLTGDVTGNASTATALAANPTDCSAGQYATAIAASGNLTCATPAGLDTVGTFSASAQTNGATISGSTITFGPASTTVPGMVSTGTQSFAGAKSFDATINIIPNASLAPSEIATVKSNVSNGPALKLFSYAGDSRKLSFCPEFACDWNNSISVFRNPSGNGVQFGGGGFGHTMPYIRMVTINGHTTDATEGTVSIGGHLNPNNEGATWIGGMQSSGVKYEPWYGGAINRIDMGYTRNTAITAGAVGSIRVATGNNFTVDSDNFDVTSNSVSIGSGSITAQAHKASTGDTIFSIYGGSTGYAMETANSFGLYPASAGNGGIGLYPTNTTGTLVHNPFIAVSTHELFLGANSGTKGAADPGRIKAPSGTAIKLDVTNRGVDIQTSGTKPTCDSTARGQLFLEEGGAGVADVLYMCMKAAADTYAWETVKAAP